MDQIKYESEAQTLRSFIKVYCDGQEHSEKQIQSFTCRNPQYEYRFEELLCKECQVLLQYSLAKLQECPYESKPRCRKCTTPCYDKKQWKVLAEVMRFSGLRLGVLKVKKIMNSLFYK
jgi:hypothetical protein